MSKQKTNSGESWEIKDRLYTLINKKPLTLRLNSKHSLRSPLLYFDEASGVQRELRYATNMSSPFVDEQKGTATLGHIVFESGKLFVPKEQQNLQKLLSLYHPKRDKEYSEHKPEMLAISTVDTLELEVDAMIIARELEIDHAEAILRVEIGSKVSKMSSKEIKREIMLLARNNAAFLRQGGRLNLKNAPFARDKNPIDENCACYTCQTFTRAYLRHLIISKEMLSATLLSIHNLHTLIHLAKDMRTAILENRFEDFAKPWFVPTTAK